MPMNPSGAEGEKEFISRCIAHHVDQGHEQDQAVAMCHSMWDKASLARELRPHVGEQMEAYVSRFMQHNPNGSRAHALAMFKLGPGDA